MLSRLIPHASQSVQDKKLIVIRNEHFPCFFFVNLERVVTIP